MADPTHPVDRTEGKDAPPLPGAPTGPGQPDERALLVRTEAEASTPDDVIEVSKTPFPVVGIGASAGGLEALEALIHRLKDAPMAFVVVQHLAAGHESMLGEILARATSLRVVTLNERMRVEASTLYVAPPEVEVTLEGDELVPTPKTTTGWPHREVDNLLRSLAAATGSMAIGVVLSGAGSDGTLGLKAIKDGGGITFAQEPTSATQASMPQSAIDAGWADFALTAAEIGDELMRLASHPFEGRPRPFKTVDRDAMAKITAQLRTTFGVDFALYKQSTVERRIARRMALNRVNTVGDYLEFLISRPNEIRSLYGDLLIGVTGFFRDVEPFGALKATVFPRIIAGRSQEVPIRIWVAGCSSGEEAYSVGIALLEFLGDRALAFKIQIFATDIDEDALARARQAVYPTTIEIDVSRERLNRFFLRTDKGYQVTRAVRDLIVFARHNLGMDPPFSHVDLVTSRNVLIYMQTALQKRVIRVFHYALRHEGHLLLGTSESVGDLADLFSLVDRKRKLYLKRDTATNAVFDLPRRRMSEREDGAEALPTDHRPPTTIGHLADRKVLEMYGPPGVIVNDALEVLQFRGRTGRYFEPAPGVATLNLLKLARPELAMPLRAVVNLALVEGTPASSPPVVMTEKEGARVIRIEVVPLAENSGRKCLLVLFKDVQEISPVASSSGDLAALANTDPRVVELQRELATTREYLQSTIEELEAANEELQSSIEEMQSSNEELQSTNEELETSKEELQSTNEELATVNDELHSRMAQLTIANDDLQNVLAYATPVIVIVGQDLRIRRFSATAERLLSLIPGDVGRPIAYLRNVLGARDIEQLASDAMTTITARELRVRGIDGFWYMMKMMPYRTADHAIRGLVVELIRTSAPMATVGPEPVPVPVQHVLAALPFPAMLVDRQLQLVWANRGFFETFSVAPSALGRPLAEAWGSTTEPPELWHFLDEVLAGTSPRDILVEQPFGRTAHNSMRFSARTMPSETDRPALYLVVMQDV